MRYVDRIVRHLGVTFDVIYSSLLRRSRDTAEYFAQHSRGSELRHSQALNEINFGIYNEKSKKWVREHVPEHKKNLNFVYPGGESYSGLKDRCSRFVERLAAIHADDTILLVVHAGVIRALVSHFLALDYAAQLDRKVSHRYVGYLEFDHGACRLYREHGKLSGFIKDAVIDIPYRPLVSVPA